MWYGGLGMRQTNIRELTTRFFFYNDKIVSFDRWGEVIPLHFISPSESTRVVILSVPSRRYTEDVAMIPEMMQLGTVHGIIKPMYIFECIMYISLIRSCNVVNY